MALWSRIANVFRGSRLNREIDEEIEAHIAQAIEEGRDPDEARRAFGSPLRKREESRDIKLLPWLDSLRGDAVFGWRQLKKRKVTSAAAILSLALAMGACTSAFRLIDALLLRPLPIDHPERLYALAHRGVDVDGVVRTDDGCAYPMFQRMRTAVKDQAEAIAISYAVRGDLTYGSDQETEKAYLQYVSGSMFRSFALRPAVGRLLDENDDLKPRAQAVAVLSFDYWTRRFGRNPKVVGRTFRFGNDLYAIVGIVGNGFTGIEPGKMTDLFVPTMMNPSVRKSGLVWFRTLIKLKPGVSAEPVREKLHAVYRLFQEEQIKSLTWMPKQRQDNILNQRILLESAASGISEMQQDYRKPLAILCLLVGLILLIACANVANLMTAQAAARAREMALRVSIGAGRSRLVQLVLVESTMLAVFASSIGCVLAWWSAPFVVSRINPPDDPARLLLPADWRVLVFGMVLTFVVAMLFGLEPAVRASTVKPAAALKGGHDSSGRHAHGRKRLIHALIIIQVAFCFFVLFVAGLFVATLNRLTRQPTGFSASRLLTLETVAQGNHPPGHWRQVAEHLRAIPGVETVALAEWPLLGENAEGGYISVDGSPFQNVAFFLDVSPGWMGVMRIPFTAGRDFRTGDAHPKVAIVNEAFVKQFFHGESAVGKTFATMLRDVQIHVRIVGLVRNARYSSLRGAMPPVAYFPFTSVDTGGTPCPRNSGTFIVRTIGSNPASLAPALRREVSQAQPDFRVNNIRTQEEINALHTMQQRLVAILALFFAIIALVLAGVGLYGVLDYSVLQRRREIAIRMAIGAQAGGIVRLVTLEFFTIVIVGVLAGLALGRASTPYIEALLYQVKPTDLGMLAVPSLTIWTAALLAVLPPVVRAVRIDPITVLRSE